MNYPFSAVISVYHLDNPSYLKLALNSLVEQCLQPNEIIIVVDGPIGPDLYGVVTSFSNLSFIRPIFLPENVGRGSARHQGILHAKHELIALMDSDDICLSNRFQLQVDALMRGKYDVLGGQIAEFSSATLKPSATRPVPLSHDAIIHCGRLKQPYNHVTLLLRKSSYLSTGGYRPLRYIEDYDLFHRMIQAGMSFANLPDVVVYVRNDGQLARRRGFPYLNEELILYRDMLSSGYLSLPIFLFNVLLRIFFRLAPLVFIEMLSSIFLRSPHRPS